MCLMPYRFQREQMASKLSTATGALVRSTLSLRRCHSLASLSLTLAAPSSTSVSPTNTRRAFWSLAEADEEPGLWFGAPELLFEDFVHEDKTQFRTPEQLKAIHQQQDWTSLLGLKGKELLIPLSEMSVTPVALSELQIMGTNPLAEDLINSAQWVRQELSIRSTNNPQTTQLTHSNIHTHSFSLYIYLYTSIRSINKTST